MNVYSCWYRGVTGYCCRNKNFKWLFVPELGQPNNIIRRNLELDDLIFRNPYEKQYEIEFELELSNRSLFSYGKKLLFRAYKPQTTGGFLFITM